MCQAVREVCAAGRRARNECSRCARVDAARRRLMGAALANTLYFFYYKLRGLTCEKPRQAVGRGTLGDRASSPWRARMPGLVLRWRSLLHLPLMLMLVPLLEVVIVQTLGPIPIPISALASLLELQLVIVSVPVLELMIVHGLVMALALLSMSMSMLVLVLVLVLELVPVLVVMVQIMKTVTVVVVVQW